MALRFSEIGLKNMAFNGNCISNSFYQFTRNSRFVGHAGKISYGLTQTPQVWLDYQVSEIAGKLYLNWDVLRGKYDDGVIAQMFSCYLDSLEK